MKILMAFLLSFAVFACDGAAQEKPMASPASSKELSIVTAKGDVHTFKIELALTHAEQERGLMNRTSMPDDHGMLFYFGHSAERSFWMKNTLIPLDMVFIRADGTIHRIATAKANDLTSVKSQGPVAAVLEINGGLADKLRIQAGDKVRHLFFQQK
jgi:uncharacterized protein